MTGLAHSCPLRRRSQVAAAIVLAFGSCLVTLYAAEAFLFVDPFELRVKHPHKGFDRRGYFEVVQDMRAQGTPAYPVLAAATWLASPPSLDGTPVLPLSGIPHATIVMCNETGTYVTYESDRFGFNGPDAMWDRPAEAALVGDSLVEGWCLPRAESFAALIRRAHPATLNLGYAGHGPLAQLGVIREYAAPRRPARVFWFFYEGNDLAPDLPRELANPILRRYVEPGFSQHLLQRSRELGADMRRTFDARLAGWTPEEPVSPAESIGKLRILRALTANAVAPPRTAAGLPPHALEDLARILVEAKRTVEAWGGSLHFVYLPDLPSAMGERDPAVHDGVLALVGRLEIPAIDLRGDFVNHPDPLSLFPYEEGRHLARTRGLHYDADGHRLVAARVLAEGWTHSW